MKATDLRETARETVKTVKFPRECRTTSLKRGVNERSAREWSIELASFKLQLFQLVDTPKKVKFTNALLAPESKIS
jgi:hypothetical protein